MNKRLFEQLLSRPESATLDFKERSYDFDKERPEEDAKFIKDVLSFCNTIRKSDGYIIIGVRHSPPGIELPGLSGFTDDAIFQQKAKDKIWPKPVFETYTFHYGGKLFGVVKFPIHHYNAPLEATKGMKGILPDTVYLRRGSGNAPATPKETINLHQWLQTIPVAGASTFLHVDEVSSLIAAFSDRGVQLSMTMIKLLAFSRKINDKDLLKFATHEIKGYYGLKDSKHKKYSFRIGRLVATPYEIELAPIGALTADQMISRFKNDEHFRDVEYFFNNSLVDLEGMAEKLNGKPTLIKLSMAYQKVFPEIEHSTIPNATIFISAQDLAQVYEGVRKIAIERLVNLST